MPELTKVEINKRISQKYCKVESEYGEGTGYILDGKNGIVVSSAHLVTAVKRLSGLKYTTNLLVLTVLHKAGYLDNELRITNKALNESKDALKSTIQNAIKETENIMTSSICITPKSIAEMIEHNEVGILEELRLIKVNPNNAFLLNTANENRNKLALALYHTGYLDNAFMITHKGLVATELELLNIVPSTEQYMIVFNRLTDAKKTEINQEDFLKNFEGFWNFLQKAKTEKEVVLLSDEVLIHYDGAILKAKIMLPEDETQKHKVLKNFAYFDTVPLEITTFSDNTPFQGRHVILTGNPIEPLPEDLSVEVGEEVYFGGYPLTQETYTFSVGMIAAIEDTGIRRDFVIEGNVLPGNSGSPVFIQREGKIYWLGVISSEVARVTERMLEIKESLVLQSEVMSVGGVQLIETMREITSTLLGNLSTGKGRVFEIGDIDKLLNPNLENVTPFKIDRYLDFLVPKKGKNNIREQVKLEIEKQKSERICEIYVYNGVNYTLSSDKHNKHITHSERISEEVDKDARSLTSDKWKNQVATFNVEFAKQYKDILKKIIKTIARNEHSDCRYVRFPESVGWDRNSGKQGEETNIIELYYEEEGSHIRPKAESWLKYNDKIINYRPIFSEGFRQNVVTLFSGSNQSFMQNKQQKLILEARFFNVKDETAWKNLKETFKQSIEEQNEKNKVLFDETDDKCLVKGTPLSIECIQEELEEYGCCRIS